MSGKVSPISSAPETDKADATDRQVASAVRSARGLKTGRVASSVLGDTQGRPSASGQVQSLFGQYASLAHQLPWEVLDYVELLATWNPDYSQAVENIKMLANSGHELIVDASSDLQKNRTKALLEDKSRMVQESHGGMDGVIDKLLGQASTFGACCGEWVLNEELNDVIDFVDISPKVIRYFWDEKEQRYLPYQKVSSKQAEEARKTGQATKGNHVALNEMTFRYFAFGAAPGSPYGVPPFLAALSNIAIQRDMVHNMAQIVKKIGLLGVIDLTVERLQLEPGESDEQYEARAGEYLDAYADIAEEMVRDGGLVHFDNVTANTWQIGGNAAGATNIHKANEELIFSGLKSMPSVQGRCLDPETRILYSDGTTGRLADVETGDLLQGFDEHTGSSRRRWREAKVENVWRVKKPSLRLELSDGRSVLCSTQHPFLMQKQNSGSLKTHRRTGSESARRDAASNAANTRWRDGDDEFKGTDWKRAEDIREGEWIKAIREPVEIDYESDDYKAGYVAGHNSGDGCFRFKAEGKRDYYTFYAPEFEEETLDWCEDYALELGLPHPFENRHRSVPRSYPEKGINASVSMVSLKTTRKSNMDFLVALHEERASDDYKAGWLSGLYDTDGSRHMKSRGREQVRICQLDGEVKNQAERYIADLGFTCSRSSVHLSILGDRMERWRFTATLRPVLDRKIVRLDEHTVRTFAPVRVEKIELVGVKELIDITTTTSTFIGNGMLTHNSFSTTETYAGVAYDIVLRNTLKYQRAIKRMIESGYWLAASLSGLKPDKISLQFNKNRALDRQQEASSERIEILNAHMLWILGILDQTGVAQRLGYSDPKTPMDDPPETISGAQPSGESEDDDFGESDKQPSTVRGRQPYEEDEEEPE